MAIESFPSLGAVGSSVGAVLQFRFINFRAGINQNIGDDFDRFKSTNTRSSK